MPSAHLRDSFPASPRLFPVISPLPLLYPLAQLRSGVRASPLRDMSVQPITAIRPHRLPFRQPLDGRAPRCALAPAPPVCGAGLPPPRLPPPWAWCGAGAGGRAEARWGPFPTDAAWGVTRGLFENLAVGAGGLELPAAFGRGRYTWRPRPSRPHKDGG